MRHNLLLISCFIVLFPEIIAQTSHSNTDYLFVYPSRHSSKSALKMGDTIRIQMRSQAAISEDKPLYVIDGLIAEESEVKKIDPNDIESIDILKEAAASTFFCFRGNQGIVIITTKNKITIKIRDAESGDPISAATVDLIYGKRKQHSTRLLTDSLGQVTFTNSKPGTKYELQVSSIGYKNYNTFINSEAVAGGYSVSLQRNYADLKEVIIIAYPPIVCRRIINCFGSEVLRCSQKCVYVFKSAKDSALVQDHLRSVKFYPNPVSRSQQVSIEFENKKAETISVRLFSLDGKLVGAKEYEVIEGMNKISYSASSQLAAGAYTIQLMNGNGKIIKTDKLIVQ